MARIPIVSLESAEGPRRDILQQAQAEYGFVPGILKILLTDLEIAGHVKAVYEHLHLRPTSPITRLQREMVATVVNGLVSGAP